MSSQSFLSRMNVLSLLSFVFFLGYFPKLRATQQHMEMKFDYALHLHPPHLLHGWNWLNHLAQILSLSQRAALPGRSSRCRIPHHTPLFLQLRCVEIPGQNLQTCQIFKGKS